MSYEPPTQPIPPEPPGGYGWQPGEPAQGQSGGMPTSMQRAVYLMYAGAALAAVGVVLNLLALDDMRQMVEAMARQQAEALPGVDAQQMADTMWAIMVPTMVIGGAIGVGLWVWMALKNKRGRAWARITATVFFGIDTLIALRALVVAPGVLAAVMPAIVWLVGLGAVIFLWREESTAYIRQSAAPSPGPGPGKAGPDGGYGAGAGGMAP